MAKAPRNPADEQDIDQHKIYAGFAMIGLLLALVTTGAPYSLGRMVSGPFGLFENLTLILYALVLALVVKTAWQRRVTFKTWKSFERLLLLAVLVVVLIGEEIQWGIPWIYATTYQAWPFISLETLLAVSYAGVPEEASLKVIAAIAGVRIGIVLAVVYGALALVMYRAKIIHASAYVKKPVALYAFACGGLLLVAALMHFGFIPGREIFEEYLEMLAAGAFLMSVSLKFN